MVREIVPRARKAYEITQLLDGQSESGRGTTLRILLQSLLLSTRLCRRLC